MYWKLLNINETLVDEGNRVRREEQVGERLGSLDIVISLRFNS